MTVLSQFHNFHSVQTIYIGQDTMIKKLTKDPVGQHSNRMHFLLGLVIFIILGFYNICITIQIASTCNSSLVQQFLALNETVV